jgi:hypothetical protein
MNKFVMYSLLKNPNAIRGSFKERSRQNIISVSFIRDRFRSTTNIGEGQPFSFGERTNTPLFASSPHLNSIDSTKFL